MKLSSNVYMYEIKTAGRLQKRLLSNSLFLSYFLLSKVFSDDAFARHN